MVLVLTDWIGFRDHVERWGHLSELIYRLDSASTGMRVRITAGSVGLDQTFHKEDATLEEIRQYLEDRRAKKVESAKEILVFFS